MTKFISKQKFRQTTKIVKMPVLPFSEDVHFIHIVGDNFFSSNFRELRTKAPTQILLNFCIALSLTLIVFIVAAERSKTSSIASCRVAAIALHYFILAVFMWMAIEAYNMYLCFVKILPTHHSHFMIKCLLAGWGTLNELEIETISKIKS